MPRGTGFNSVCNVNPSKETPALANAKIGIIPKATYGDKPCSNFNNNDSLLSLINFNMREHRNSKLYYKNLLPILLLFAQSLLYSSYQSFFHTLEKIDSINPRVIVAEYNAKYGPSLEWKTNYDKNLNWDGSDNYGASLKSFEKMLSLKKYKLVGCNISGVNAFFVKEELINNNFEKDFSSEYHFNEGRYWLKNAFEKQYNILTNMFVLLN